MTPEFTCMNKLKKMPMHLNDKRLSFKTVRFEQSGTQPKYLGMVTI